jgi:hypothetical protein
MARYVDGCRYPALETLLRHRGPCFVDDIPGIDAGDHLAVRSPRPQNRGAHESADASVSVIVDPIRKLGRPWVGLHVESLSHGAENRKSACGRYRAGRYVSTTPPVLAVLESTSSSRLSCQSSRNSLLPPRHLPFTLLSSLPCSVFVPRTGAIPGNTTTPQDTSESGSEQVKRSFPQVAGLLGSLQRRGRRFEPSPPTP